MQLIQLNYKNQKLFGVEKKKQKRQLTINSFSSETLKKMASLPVFLGSIESFLFIIFVFVSYLLLPIFSSPHASLQQ